MADDRKAQEQPGAQENSPKEPYATPTLIVHGSIETLTQALNTGTKDGLTGSILL